MSVPTKFFLSEEDWNLHRPAGAIAPQVDFDKPDLDHTCAGYAVAVEDLGLGEGVKGYVALADLPPGAIDDSDADHPDDPYFGLKDWRNAFDRNDVYPPIKVEVSDGHLFQLDGNHRRIIWAEWGYTHAPAFIVFSRREVPKERPPIHKPDGSGAASAA